MVEEHQVIFCSFLLVIKVKLNSILAEIIFDFI